MSSINISKQLRRLDGTYFRVIPRDVVDVIAAMLTYTSTTRVKLVSSNRLCGAEDFRALLTIDHKYRRYIMHERKYKDAVKKSEYWTEPAKYDHYFHTISADGTNVQKLPMDDPIEYPEWSVDGIRSHDSYGYGNFVQFMHDGTVHYSDSIDISYYDSYGHGTNRSRYQDHKKMVYWIGHEHRHELKVNASWGDDWIVDPIHHANYISHDGHSRQTLVVINMLTGKRVFSSYGETAKMIAKLRNYWVTLDATNCTARIYGQGRETPDVTVNCTKKGYTDGKYATRLFVGTDPNTFVVAQNVRTNHHRFIIFVEERYEKWVSVYQVYEHIVFA